MPFALIIVGLVLVIASVRDTVTDSGNDKGLVTLLKGDLLGQNNYIYWFVSILVIGALGYIETLKPFSRAFMALIVVGLFLSKGGQTGISFFTNFQSALSSLGSGLNLGSSSLGVSPASASDTGVNNLPINLGGIIGTYTGSLADLAGVVSQGGIEAPLSSGRNH